MNNQTQTIKDLMELKARISAVVRGLRSDPNHIEDYCQVLEVHTLLLEKAIITLKEQLEET